MTPAEMTPLDAAHATMTGAPDDPGLRLRFYERIADAELILWLKTEVAGDTLDPKVFDLEEGPVILAFDREERLAEFAGSPQPYAALPGRVAARMLAGQGVGLGVNLGVAPSATLLPPEAVDWLAQMLDTAPTETLARPVAFLPPGDLPETLVTGLDAKLARAAGLAGAALLSGVRYGDGRHGHMLAIIGAKPGAEGALARAVAEALAFSNLDAGELDVTFLAPGDPAAAVMARVALRFDLPEPVADPAPQPPAAPGTDPNRPPRLR